MVYVTMPVMCCFFNEEGNLIQFFTEMEFLPSVWYLTVCKISLFGLLYLCHQHYPKSLKSSLKDNNSLMAATTT